MNNEPTNHDQPQRNDPLAPIGGEGQGEGAHDTPETPGNLGLRIFIPAGPVLSVAFSASNWFGSVALRAFLERVLAQAGLLNEKVTFAGEFNASVYIFKVTDTRLASQLILRELKPLALSKWAQLACMPQGQTKWQTLHPLPACAAEADSAQRRPEPADFAQFVTTEALAALSTQAKQIFAAVAESIQKNRENT